MKKPKILLIDDEKEIIEMVKIRMEVDGTYEVTAVYSGKDGVAKVKEMDFDLVITDYNMPHMDGGEVLDIIKKIKPDLPIFMFSVYHDDDSTITSVIRDKADGIVAKPIDFDKLHKTIAELLAGQSARGGKNG